MDSGCRHVLQGDEEERGKAMIRLLVPQRVVRGYRDGSIRQLRLVMRPQPWISGEGTEYECRHDCGFYDTGGNEWACRQCGAGIVPLPDRNGRCSCFHAPVLPGQEFWMPETWYDNLFDRSDAQRENQEEVYYRADGLPEFEGEENEIRWSPSTNMPQWAARTFGKARTVRIGRVQEIMPHEAKAEGYGGHSNSGIAILADCMATWDAEHPRDLWAGNPWTWIIEPERSKA